MKSLHLFFCPLYLCTISLEAVASLDTAVVSEGDVINFLHRGWLTIRNLLPDLSDASITRNIYEAEARARLKYVPATFKWLNDVHGVNCDGFKERCGHWNFDDFNATYLPTSAVHQVTDKGMRYLDCCMLVANAKYRGDGSDKTVGFPYYQSLNPHRWNDAVHKLATSKRMGLVAARLLQDPQIRLYQTAIFQKSNRTLNQETGWHQDLNMVPLDTGFNGYLTFWCPLTPLSAQLNDSLVVFATGSHRDVSFLHWFPSDMRYEQRKMILSDRYDISSAGSLEVGDCTVHHGWTWHTARVQPNTRPPRMAIAFSYVSNTARVLPDLPGNTTRHHRPFTYEDAVSYEDWLPDLEPMTNINHPLLPLVYDERNPSYLQHETKSNSTSYGSVTSKTRVKKKMKKLKFGGSEL